MFHQRVDGIQGLSTRDVPSPIEEIKSQLFQVTPTEIVPPIAQVSVNQDRSRNKMKRSALDRSPTPQNF